MIRLLLLSLLFSAGAQAAGMATHALMAEYGRDYLPADHPLRSIVEAHRPALLAGAMYPDGGYATGAGFASDRDVAETAHWEYFVAPLIQHLHDTGCLAAAGQLASIPLAGGVLGDAAGQVVGAAPLADLRQDDSCGARIAFAMGVAAHGLGDEVWDSLFEPQVRERGEEAASSPAYTLDVFPPGADPSVGTLLRGVVGDAGFAALREAFDPLSLNSIEYAMDVMAIRQHDIWLDVPYLVFPPWEDLAAAYAANGMDVDVLAVQRVALATRTLVAAERAGAALEYDRVRQQMPFAARHYFTGSGGVVHTGKMIAGYWQHLWQKLQSGVQAAPGPLVVGVHPDPGERDVPAGASPDRFVRVYLSSAVARDSVQARPGALVLFDEQGRIVPVSLTEVGPLYQGAGAHGIGVQVSGELLPGHEYTAVLTTRAADDRGQAVREPVVWSFRTAE